MKTILSLCDYSGVWPRPYAEAGYRVILVDPKHPGHTNRGGMLLVNSTVQELKLDILELDVHGILAAPPCTDFTRSGAQYWPAKDADGRTANSLDIVKTCLWLVRFMRPVWWAMENPVGRLPRLIPELGRPWYFQPFWFGDAYSKKTGLWGSFNRDLPRRCVKPIRYTKQGSWTQKYGGSSERTKEARSMTPPGFANAFFQANP